MKIPFFSDGTGIFHSRTRNNPPRLKVDIVRSVDENSIDQANASSHGTGVDGDDTKGKGSTCIKDKKKGFGQQCPQPRTEDSADNHCNNHHHQQSRSNGSESYDGKDGTVQIAAGTVNSSTRRGSGLNQKMKKLTSTIPHLFSSGHGASSTTSSNKGSGAKEKSVTTAATTMDQMGCTVSGCRPSQSTSASSHYDGTTASRTENHTNCTKSSHYNSLTASTTSSSSMAFSNGSSSFYSGIVGGVGGSLGRKKKTPSSSTTVVTTSITNPATAQYPRETQMISKRGSSNRPVSDYENINSRDFYDNHMNGSRNADSKVKLLSIGRRGSIEGVAQPDHNKPAGAVAPLGWIDSDTSTSSSDKNALAPAPPKTRSSIGSGYGRKYDGSCDLKLIYENERPKTAAITRLPDLTALPGPRRIVPTISMVVASTGHCDAQSGRTPSAQLKREDTLVYRTDHHQNYHQQPQVSVPEPYKQTKPAYPKSSADLSGSYQGSMPSQSLYGTIKTGRLTQSDIRNGTITGSSQTSFAKSTAAQEFGRFNGSHVINSSISSLYVTPDNDKKPLLFVPLPQPGLPSAPIDSEQRKGPNYPARSVFGTEPKVYGRLGGAAPAFTRTLPYPNKKGVGYYMARLNGKDGEEDAGIMSEFETSCTGYYKGGSNKKDDSTYANNSHTGSMVGGSYRQLAVPGSGKGGREDDTNSLGRRIPPIYGTDGVIFLRFGHETKRVPIPYYGIKDIQDVRALFLKTFPKNLTQRKLEKFYNVYVQDNDSPKEIFYELDDFSEITNRTVLKLMETVVGDGIGRDDMSPTSDMEKEGHETDAESYYGSRYGNDLNLLPLERECDLSYYSEPEYNPNRRARANNYKVGGGVTGVNRFGNKVSESNSTYRDSPKFSSQIVGKSEYSDAERPLAKQIVLLSSEQLQDNPRSPSKFAKQKQILDNMEARLSDKLYEGRNGNDGGYRSQSLSTRKDIPWDMPDTKTKMDTMEKKLKVLTNMVQKALVKSPSPYNTDESAEYGNHSLLSRSASSVTNPVAGLRSLQRKALEIKLDVKALRDLTRIHVLDLNKLLAQAKNKIIQICKYAPSSSMCQLSTTLRHSLDEFDEFFEDNNCVTKGSLGIEGMKKEIRVYHQDMAKLEKVLNDLEISVEECRNDIVNNKSKVQVADIESMALALSYASRAVSDLKSRYPRLEKMLINGVKNNSSMMDEEDRGAFMKERQIFLKIEPEKLENSLKRCKKLTATLYTLKKMTTSGAMYINQSHPMLIGPSRSPSNQSLISMRSSNLGSSCSNSRINNHNHHTDDSVHSLKLNIRSTVSSPEPHITLFNSSHNHYDPRILKTNSPVPNITTNGGDSDSSNLNKQRSTKFSMLPLLTLPYTPETEECDVTPLYHMNNCRNVTSDHLSPSRTHRYYSSVRSCNSSRGGGGGGSCYSAGGSANDSSISSSSARSSPVFGAGLGSNKQQVSLGCSHLPRSYAYSESEDGRTSATSYYSDQNKNKNASRKFQNSLTTRPPLTCRARVNFKADSTEKEGNSPILSPSNGSAFTMDTISKQLEDSISHLYEMGTGRENCFTRNVADDKRIQLIGKSPPSAHSSPLPRDLKDIHDTNHVTGYDISRIDGYGSPNGLQPYHYSFDGNYGINGGTSHSPYASQSDNRSQSSGRASVLSTKSEPFLRAKHLNRSQTNMNEKSQEQSRGEINQDLEQNTQDLSNHQNSFPLHLPLAISVAPPPPKRNRSMVRSPVVSPTLISSGNLSPIKEMSPNCYNNHKLSGHPTKQKIVHCFNKDEDGNERRVGREENFCQNSHDNRTQNKFSSVKDYVTQNPLPINLEELYQTNISPKSQIISKDDGKRANVVTNIYTDHVFKGDRESRNVRQSREKDINETVDKSGLDCDKIRINDHNRRPLEAGIARIHQPGEMIPNIQMMKSRKGISTITKINRVTREYEHRSNNSYMVASGNGVENKQNCIDHGLHNHKGAYSDTEDIPTQRSNNHSPYSDYEVTIPKPRHQMKFNDGRVDKSDGGYDGNCATNGFGYKSEGESYRTNNNQRNDTTGYLNFNHPYKGGNPMNENPYSYNSQVEFKNPPLNVLDNERKGNGNASMNEDSSSVSFDSQDDLSKKHTHPNTICETNPMITSTMSDKIGTTCNSVYHQLIKESQDYTSVRTTSLIDINKSIPPCAPPLPNISLNNGTMSNSQYLQSNNTLLNVRPNKGNISHNGSPSSVMDKKANEKGGGPGKSFTIPRQVAPGTFRQEFANIQKQLAAEAAQAKHNRQVAMMNKRSNYKSDQQFHYQNQISFPSPPNLSSQLSHEDDTRHSSTNSILSETDASINPMSSQISGRRSSVSSIKSIGSDGPGAKNGGHTSYLGQHDQPPYTQSVTTHVGLVPPKPAVTASMTAQSFNPHRQGTRMGVSRLASTSPSNQHSNGDTSSSDHRSQSGMEQESRMDGKSPENRLANDGNIES